jgi:hypothetical protein
MKKRSKKPMELFRVMVCPQGIYIAGAGKDPSKRDPNPERTRARTLTKIQPTPAGYDFAGAIEIAIQKYYTTFFPDDNAVSEMN